MNEIKNKLLKIDMSADLKSTILKTSPLYKEIVSQTFFLGEKVPLRQRIWHIINETEEVPLCINCNKNKVNWHKKEYLILCSNKCANESEYRQERIRNTNIKKYGVENAFASEEIKEKIKKTNVKKYGVENAMQSKSVQDKVKQTHLKRYGVENAMQSKSVQDKVKQTHLKRYGVECSFQNKDIRKKIEQTNIERYGVKNVFASEEIKEKIKQTHIRKYGVSHPIYSKEINEKRKNTLIEKYGGVFTRHENMTSEKHNILNNKEVLEDMNKNKNMTLAEISRKIGVSSSVVYLYFKKHGIKIKYNISSRIEEDVYNWIVGILNHDVERRNRKLISPKELDIYITDKKLAIEINGIYWHSELNGKDKNYHIDKTLECNKNDIRLIQIFETEWILKEDIVKSRISTLLGYSNKIYARKCEIREISSDDKRYFIEKTHIQGDIPSSINIGLFYENKLVMVMTFGKSRFNKNYQYELLRMSSELNTNVIGGANKLFQYFIRKYSPESVISYCDLRWNTGNVYSKLGFEYSNRSSPNFWYFHIDDPFKLYSRIKFQKYKLNDILTIYNPELTAYDNMLNNGFDRVWDCGNDVWIKKFNK